jgi:hypothetical protein
MSRWQSSWSSSACRRPWQGRGVIISTQQDVAVMLDGLDPLPLLLLGLLCHLHAGTAQHVAATLTTKLHLLPICPAEQGTSQKQDMTEGW